MEQGPLRNSDILIMCSLSQTPLANPDAMIGEFCVNTGESFSSNLFDGLGMFIVLCEIEKS